MAVTLKTGDNLNLTAMGKFWKINDKGSRYTLVSNGDKLECGGKLNPLATKLTRYKSTIAANNDLRTQLLKCLGSSFGLLDSQMGKSDGKGKFSFSSDFLSQLKDQLGDTLKFDDFGIDVDKGGVVSSGKPLTERRVTAINQKLADLKGKYCREGLGINFGKKGEDFSDFVADIAIAFGDAFDDEFAAQPENIIHAIDGRGDYRKKFRKDLRLFYYSARADYKKCKTDAELYVFFKRVDTEIKKRVGGFLCDVGVLLASKDEVAKKDLQYGNPTGELLDFLKNNEAESED